MSPATESDWDRWSREVGSDLKKYADDLKMLASRYGSTTSPEPTYPPADFYEEPKLSWDKRKSELKALARDFGSTAESEPASSPGPQPSIESLEWRSDREAREAWGIATDFEYEVSTSGGKLLLLTVTYY
jgi:hypothetical protein